MSNILTGPLVRQLVQFGSGAIAGAGIVTESDVTTVVGAITALINLVWVIYARIVAGK